ncbi:MAG: indolepyruvate oxidoreductase subunit beta [Anaerolineales bacterium]
MHDDPLHELNVLICGLGGQGVVFLTRLLTETAVKLGHAVLVSETHGMSQRGGSVVSHVRLGQTESPLIRRGTADVLLATEADEAVRSLGYLRRGGAAFVNSANGLREAVQPHVERLGLDVRCLPASKIAMELGAAAVTNVVLAGFACAHPALPLPEDRLQETLLEIVPRGKELNSRAFAAGRAFAADAQLSSA